MKYLLVVISMLTLNSCETVPKRAEAPYFPKPKAVDSEKLGEVSHEGQTYTLMKKSPKSVEIIREECAGDFVILDKDKTRDAAIEFGVVKKLGVKKNKNDMGMYLMYRCKK